MDTPAYDAQQTEIVKLAEDGSAFTTSLIVAEAFGKRHKDVLKAIDNLDCTANFNGRNFALAEYIDSKGERRRVVQISRDGFAFLGMGFTGKKAAAWKEKFIEAFNAMEKELQKRQINHEKDTGTEEPQTISVFSRKLCTEAQVAALRSMIIMWCSFDGVPVTEAEQILCATLRIDDLSQLIQADFQYAFEYCWRNTHRTLPHQRIFDGSGDVDQEKDFIRLASYQSGISVQGITDYVCQMCGINSLEEAEKASSKVLLTIWGVLVRVTADPLFDSLV